MFLIILFFFGTGLSMASNYYHYHEHQHRTEMVVYSAFIVEDNAKEKATSVIYMEYHFI